MLASRHKSEESDNFFFLAPRNTLSRSPEPQHNKSNHHETTLETPHTRVLWSTVPGVSKLLATPTKHQTCEWCNPGSSRAGHLPAEYPPNNPRGSRRITQLSLAQIPDPHNHEILLYHCWHKLLNFRWCYAAIGKHILIFKQHFYYSTYSYVLFETAE